MTNAKVSPFQPVVTLGGKKLNDFGDRLDSERFRKVAAGRVLALRSHPNARGTQRAEAESVLCLGACAVAAVVRARLRTALVEGHLAIVDPLFVARLAAEPLLGGAGRLDVARFAVGTRAGREKSQHGPCNDKKPCYQTHKSAAGKFHHVASWKCQTADRVYSPLMFAALRIGHHFSISAVW